MAEGIWSMDEDGNFTLNPAYQKVLDEARLVASDAWFVALSEYLAEKTGYSAKDLCEELFRRIQESDRPGGMELAQSFILDALSGDL
jgi:hypothetical protein